ncbi:presenilin family intramembrane aspartyl protease [Haloarcula sp. S1AR25-5A]|uniref:Presenilin family intramembrane aspartyl protease n=1 Tax=Haloarcula terrestris TaxID=2950533 RepID=A0AAE4JH59_9EURY|nr:presenilin family intramembrane aspartyl protease PSH [Haloarcula terrestris]MDS0222217.1 presenilin family intramembrane aspartyl protease [Haloarcula terrestris]
MERRWRILGGCGLIAGIFLFVQLGALALVQPFESAGYQAVEDPSDPTNSLMYIGAILVATVVMLLAFRYDVDQLIRGLIVFSAAWLSLYVFQVLVPPVLTYAGLNVVAVALALGLGAALLLYPEWYVIDAAGAVMGAAAAGLFGISFGILPALVLLTVLAVYDAISVYGTEHMLTLASGVMDLKVPVVLVIPMTLSYSYLDAATPDPAAAAEESDESPADEPGTDPDGPAVADGSQPAAEAAAAEPESDEETDDSHGDPLERDALFIGLGDAIIPSILVASAAFFASADVLTVFGVPLPALTAMVGSYVGLAILLWMVLKGRAHAGLPLLNGGTIAGYIVGALAAGISLIDALGLGPYL